MPLQRDPVGLTLLPDPLPDSAEGLLALSRELVIAAAEGQGAGAPKYDRPMAQLGHVRASIDHLLSQETVETSKRLHDAHASLERATRALKAATWWLAGATVALGCLEVYKTIAGH